MAGVAPFRCERPRQPALVVRLVTALFGRPSDVAGEPILVTVLRAQFSSSYQEERHAPSASRDLAVHFKNILHEGKHSVTITAEKEIVSVKEKLCYTCRRFRSRAFLIRLRSRSWTIRFSDCGKDQNGDAKSGFSSFKGLLLLRNPVAPDLS